jgi:ribonuclease HI
MLARAAWGLRCDGLHEPNYGGPVDGSQTAQRAEVTAVVAATRVVGSPIDLATDSANIAAGADVAEWEHADLWQQLVDPVRSGRLRARWVPAHKTAAQAQHLGVSERDRLGNAAADGNAGAAAARRALPQEAVDRRLRA